MMEVELPDGRVLEIDAPTPQAAAQAAKAFMSKNAAPAPEPVYDAAGNATGAQQLPMARASMPFSEQMSNVGGALDKGARMVANGATFGLADKFAGGMDAVTGQAPSYDAGVKAQRAQTQAVRDANPGPAAVAEAAGGVASGAGLIKGGLTLAGRVGTRLFPRILGYGAEGAAYGGAHGAGNTYSDKAGDYVDNAKGGAALGLLVGGGLPIAGTAASGAYRVGSAFLGPRIEGASRGASAMMRGAAQADEAGLRALPQSGEAMLPDAGPAMLGLAQGAGTGTGAGRTELVNALRTRDQGTGPRLARALDENLGQAPVPSRIEAHLSGDRAYVGQEYGPVLDRAAPANTQQLADSLDRAATGSRGAAQRAVTNVRQMLNEPGIVETPTNSALATNAGTLHSTRQAIDGLLATEVNPDVIRRLTLARQEIDAELARSAPGIKAVDAQIEESARQSAGLQRGTQVLDTGKTAIRPVELAQEMQQGAQPGGQLVGPSAVPFRIKQGVRSDIDRRVGTNVNDLTQLERTFATPEDWNYQKLGTVFGEGPRDRVAQAITENRRMRQTYQDVVQNSQTAQRTQSAQAMEGGQGGNVPHDTTLTGIGLKAVNLIAKAMSGAGTARTKDEIGRLLAQSGPGARRLAAELLASAQTTGATANSIAALISSPRWIAASGPAEGRRPTR